jgi:hypothetical protein
MILNAKMEGEDVQGSDGLTTSDVTIKFRDKGLKVEGQKSNGELV